MRTCVTYTSHGYTKSEARAVITWGAGVGPSLSGANVAFPSGATSGQAGWVYGYKSINDYWARVYDLNQHMYIYHVINGSKTLEWSESATVSTGVDYNAAAFSFSSSSVYPWSFGYTNGTPSGKVGVYSTITGVTFDTPQAVDGTPASSLVGRWDRWRIARRLRRSATATAASPDSTTISPTVTVMLR